MGAISLSLGETKSNIDLSKEEKAGNDLTWDEATWTWDEATGSWDRPGYVLTKSETKSAVSLSLEAK